MNVPEWKDKDEFRSWWTAYVIAFNRLSVTDPEEWERIAKKVEAFQIKHRGY